MGRVSRRVVLFLCVTHCVIGSLNLKIGFDYDDTLSFSTPAFDKAFASRDSGVVEFSPEFWGIVNANHRLEKKKAGVISWAVFLKLLGFDIVVVTARLPINTDALVASWDWLHDGFYFTKEKDQFMKRYRFLVFIGDSDSDIEQAQAAGVWAVRARRSPESSYKENYSPGKFREWVLPFSG